MQDLLGTTLILLVACSLAAVVTAMLKLPALLGYLAVGAALGPSLAAWIVPGAALSFLSELGGGAVAVHGGAGTGDVARGHSRRRRQWRSGFNAPNHYCVNSMGGNVL
jgi:hypothetical protein